MKSLVICLSLISVGCFSQSYDSTRVGPDRFTITSSGNDQGPENYGHILETAYGTCHQAGFKDYVVVQTVLDTRRVIVFVKCESDVVGQGFAQMPAAPEAQPTKDTNHQSSWSEDLSDLYQTAKKKIKEATQ
jgi:hypothetical protein